MNDLKVVFMGTPEFAVPVLESLIKNTNVLLVVSQPDKLVGRKQILTNTPVKECALKHNIKVFQPVKIRNDYEDILKIKPDIIITCAYGQIIPKELLDLPKLGCINVHASLLPKLRGGAPLHHAIMDGYKKTGVTIMYMDELMDNGDIISQSEIDILDSDNLETIHDKLSLLGSTLLMETLPSIINKTNKRVKQSESEVTYAWNIKREEEHIDFSKTRKEIFNQIRGLNSWPLANILLDKIEIKVILCYTENSDSNSINGTIIDIRKDAIGIKCSDGIVYITRIKPFGKKIMDVKDYLNGINKNELLGKVCE